VHHEIAYGRLATVLDKGTQDNTNFATMPFAPSPQPFQNYCAFNCRVGALLIVGEQQTGLSQRTNSANVSFAIVGSAGELDSSTSATLLLTVTNRQFFQAVSLKAQLI
jgi:hypothetical protein